LISVRHRVHPDPVQTFVFGHGQERLVDDVRLGSFAGVSVGRSLRVRKSDRAVGTAPARIRGRPGPDRRRAGSLVRGRSHQREPANRVRGSIAHSCHNRSHVLGNGARSPVSIDLKSCVLSVCPNAERNVALQAIPFSSKRNPSKRTFILFLMRIGGNCLENCGRYSQIITFSMLVSTLW